MKRKERVMKLNAVEEWLKSNGYRKKEAFEFYPMDGGDRRVVLSHTTVRLEEKEGKRWNTVKASYLRDVDEADVIGSLKEGGCDK